MRTLQGLTARLRKAFRSSAGAFDLPSIITGVVVVGILAAGVLAAVFGVIPWAQDNAAKQDLDSVRTAQGVSKVKEGSFEDAAGLSSKAYLPVTDSLTVATDASKSCYVATSKSGSGKVFYNTSTKPEPALYVPGTTDTSDCVAIDIAAPPAGDANKDPIVASIPSGAAYVDPANAESSDTRHAISGYAPATTALLDTWDGLQDGTVAGGDGYWYPNTGDPIILKHFDPASKTYVEFYNRPANYGDDERDSEVYQEDNLIFVHLWDDTALSAAELDGFQKLLDNGGSLSFDSDSTSGNPVQVYFAPTEDRDGYEDYPTWPPVVIPSGDGGTATYKADTWSTPDTSYTNTVTDPRFTNNEVSSWAFDADQNNSGTNAVARHLSSGGRGPGGGAMEVTFTNTIPASSIPESGVSIQRANIPMNTSDYTVWVKTEQSNVSVGAYFEFWYGGVRRDTNNQDSKNLVPGEWTPLHVTGYGENDYDWAGPYSAAHVSLGTTVPSGGQVVIQVDDLYLGDKIRNGIPDFNGSTADSADWNYSWNGAEDASTSTATQVRSIQIPSTAPVGSTVQVIGKNYVPGELVDIGVGWSMVGTVTVRPDGTFDSKVTIPADTWPSPDGGIYGQPKNGGSGAYGNINFTAAQ